MAPTQTAAYWCLPQKVVEGNGYFYVDPEANSFCFFCKLLLEYRRTRSWWPQNKQYRRESWEKKKIKDCEIILCVRRISVNETCILQISGSHIGNAIFLDVSLTAQNEVWVLQLNSFSICLNSPWLPALETDAHPLLIVDYCSHHLGRKAKPHQENRQTLWLLENTGRSSICLYPVRL